MGVHVTEQDVAGRQVCIRTRLARTLGQNLLVVLVLATALMFGLASQDKESFARPAVGDSARGLVDGASPVRIFFSLMLPVSVPALASLAIFQFLWVWNDLLVALIYLGGQPSVAPMTVTVSNLVNSLGQDWQLLTAAAFISMALPLVVFFSLQPYFVRGIMAGSVKG